MRRTLLLAALCAATGLNTSLRAQDAKPPTPPAKPGAPANAAPAAPAAGRTAEQVQADLQATGEELRKAFDGPEAIVDPARRKAAAPKVIPLMKRMLAALDEMAQLRPQEREPIDDVRLEYTTMLALFGDADSAAALDRIARAGQGADAVEAKCGQQVVAFLADPKDEAAQLKVVDRMRQIAKANPKEPAVAQTLMKMANMGAASKAVSERAEDVIVNDLTGDLARQIGEQIRGERLRRDSVGKPVELAGTKLDGGAFSTKDWRGKVVLVDFWATWCPPCVESLPKLKKAYLEYHAKGLEIVGVSSDTDLAQLRDFLGRNKDMPWPQLAEPKLDPESFHPLARRWGVSAIPTMFLIDRKGVLRSVDAEQNFQELIPKLLAEKAD